MFQKFFSIVGDLFSDAFPSDPFDASSISSVTDALFSSSASDSSSWSGPSVNIDGTPMMSGGMVDIHGNAFGVTDSWSSSTSWDSSSSSSSWSCGSGMDW